MKISQGTKIPVEQLDKYIKQLKKHIKKIGTLRAANTVN